MSPRLLIALALSCALHASLLAPALLQRRAAPPRRPALLAELRAVPKPAAPNAMPPAEPLLKNTLDAAAQPAEPEPPAPKVAPNPAKPAKPSATPPARNDARSVRGAQRKLFAHVFYPPEAITRGLEGEVRLLLRLSPEGTVEEVSVAASSGHALLDNAAVKAAYAMGRLPAGSPRELILPVVFRLQ